MLYFLNKTNRILKHVFTKNIAPYFINKKLMLATDALIQRHS